jgi:hypothetical protein
MEHIGYHSWWLGDKLSNGVRISVHGRVGGKRQISGAPSSLTSPPPEHARPPERTVGPALQSGKQRDGAESMNLSKTVVLQMSRRRGIQVPCIYYRDRTMGQKEKSEHHTGTDEPPSTSLQDKVNINTRVYRCSVVSATKYSELITCRCRNQGQGTGMHLRYRRRQVSL